MDYRWQLLDDGHRVFIHLILDSLETFSATSNIPDPGCSGFVFLSVRRFLVVGADQRELGIGIDICAGVIVSYLV